MHKIETNNMAIELAGDGSRLDLIDKRQGTRISGQPHGWWRIIIDDGPHKERTLTPELQEAKIKAGPDRLEVSYEKLRDAHGVIALRAHFCFEVRNGEIHASSSLQNYCDGNAFAVPEVQFPLISGIRSLGTSQQDDFLVWPDGCGCSKIVDPLEADFTAYRSSDIYQQPDHICTAIHLLYPGGSSGGALMSWFGLFHQNGGLYIGSHDPEPNKVLLYCERAADRSSLTLGTVRFPWLYGGGEWTSAPTVLALEDGGWQAGARRYRSWAESSWWQPPSPPDWVQFLQGWVRIIQLHEYGEILFPFQSVPAIASDGSTCGINNVFLLGWNTGGFSNNWPDYTASDALGGHEEMRSAIGKVHQAGGTVTAFVSYSTVDPNSSWYRETGHKLTNRNYYGLEKTFPEVYSALGTWRRAVNGVKHNRVVCSHSEEWNTLMREVGERLVEDGVDAVLYDAPGFNLFCFAEGHGHDGRPSAATARLPENLAMLRAAIREKNPRAAIFIENTIDRLQSVTDLAQSAPIRSIDSQFWSLYRYTFPEHIMTNRVMGLDQRNCREHIAFTLLYGMRFDMSVFRCQGSLRDIPEYAGQLTTACRFREALPDLLLMGKFCDEEGVFLPDGVWGKRYTAESRDGVVLWNRSVTAVAIGGVTLEGRAPDAWHALEDAGASSPIPDVIKPGGVGVLVYVIA